MNAENAVKTSTSVWVCTICVLCDLLWKCFQRFYIVHFPIHNPPETPMKITHIRSQIVKLPADEPLAGGPSTPGATRDFVALTIGTDQGVEGIGFSFFGGALTGALKVAIDALGALTVGEDPLKIEAIIAKLRGAAGQSGPGGIFTLALAAIDIALWDIKGKALNLPLSRFWADFASACRLTRAAR